MNLLILGAGELGQVVKEHAQRTYSKIDFLDDHSAAALAPLAAYRGLKDTYPDAMVAIGNNEIRMAWIAKLEKAGYNLPSFISEKAYVSPSARIAQGCFIEPMAVVNANAIVEKGSIISAGAIVNHNAVVREGCHIDCNAVVGAEAVVPEKTLLTYGQVLKKQFIP